MTETKGLIAPIMVSQRHGKIMKNFASTTAMFNATDNYNKAMNYIAKGYGPVTIQYSEECPKLETLGTFLDEDTFVLYWAQEVFLDGDTPSEKSLNWAENYIIRRDEVDAWDRLIETIGLYETYYKETPGEKYHFPGCNNWIELAIALQTGEYRANWGVNDEWCYAIDIDFLPVGDVTPEHPEEEDLL